MTLATLVDSLIFFCLRQLARWRSPWLAARLLLLVTRPLNGWASRNRHSKYRVLVLQRTGFLQDVEETFFDAPDFEVVCWPNFALKAFASALLSPSLDHNGYRTNDPAIEATKLAYRHFLSKTWKYFSRARPIDAVLTGNFAYYSEREMAAALEGAGTPFIALHKENVRAARRLEFWHTVYKDRRGHFSGRKILVYNEIERSLQIASGVAEAQKILVTGMPRLDRIHRWRQERARGNSGNEHQQILFFAFAPHEKLTAVTRKPSAGVPGNQEELGGEWGKISWKELCEKTYHVILKITREHPEFRMIVKTKGQSRGLAEVFDLLHADGKTLPPNLEVVTGGDPFQLIAESCVIIGFNTTGLLEAIAAGKPVIVPWFGEVCDESRHDLVIDLADAVEYADSSQALAEKLCHYATKPGNTPFELPHAASSVLRHWVGNVDGGAGRRVLDAIQHEISR